MQLITFFDFLYSVDFFFKMNLDSGKFRFKLREKTIHEFLILIQFCHLLEITSQTMLIVTLTYEWILCSGSQRAILLNKINSHHRPSIYTYITICTTIFAICEKKLFIWKILDVLLMWERSIMAAVGYRVGCTLMWYVYREHYNAKIAILNTDLSHLTRRL